MKRGIFALVALLAASTASATPILTTSGTWTPVPPACECGNAPWSGFSADSKKAGAPRNLGYVLQELGLADGLEYLADGVFSITEWAGTQIHQETAWTNATLTESGGALWYSDGHGAPFSSNVPRSGPGFFMLLRREMTWGIRLYVAVNDTWPGDADVQDGLWVMDIPRPPVVCQVGCGRPEPVPEASVVAMLGLGLLGAARRFRRR